jgi:hypothetical protein
MPLSKYNRHFGGKASRAYRAMVKQYGSKKGRQVFYATVRKRQKS